MEEDIKQLIAENKKLLKSIQRSMRIGAFFSFLRFVVILVPFILAAVYLPPLWKDYQQSLEDAFMGESIRLPQGFDISDLEQYIERK